jgi:hypothetical protein
MPRYTIIPTDRSSESAEIEAVDGAGVLDFVGRLDCQEADVLQDGVYAFSVRLSPSGMWSIFRREDDGGVPDIPELG